MDKAELLLCKVCNRLVTVRQTLDDLSGSCRSCQTKQTQTSRKQVKKTLKGEDSQERFDLLRAVKDVRCLLSRPRKFSLKHTRERSSQEIRSLIIEKILDSMIQTEKLAKCAPEIVEKGSVDVTRAKYYQLLGYLGQVLDGVLRSSEAREVDSRLRAVEVFIHDLKKGKAQKNRV